MTLTLQPTQKEATVTGIVINNQDPPRFSWMLLRRIWSCYCQQRAGRHEPRPFCFCGLGRGGMIAGEADDPFETGQKAGSLGEQSLQIQAQRNAAGIYDVLEQHLAIALNGAERIAKVVEQAFLVIR